MVKINKNSKYHLILTRIKTKQNKTKQNKTKQNKTKQNKTKQNKTKQNKTKQNKITNKIKNENKKKVCRMYLVADPNYPEPGFRD
ncbi:hypothetical protein [Methanosarcina sp. 2.H.A.1B.4]|uniref:hypothetical protein n=1 Tax=Methanosarcina sp. 2.H.A.1B.4 TaxID=1483600 RepID=UPI0006210C2E|nr:hypothetical protein [Methanosarcina sp. 2.H.A.1B.4]KKG09213.1 hypothetical protein EO92_01135 [Methanosarcina sp. 2.H.A.1B.4]